MRARRILIAFSSLAVIAAGLTLTPSASADSVQVQSYQRATQSEACSAQPGETPWQAAWGADSSWHPTWEQWANGNAGGWTCTRSIVWAHDSAPMYAVGDTGPGGGLVFLVSGGLRYEMAPKTWSGSSIDDTPLLAWCSDTSSNIAGAAGILIGTGSANTAAMQPPGCTSGAAVSARAYRGGGLADWFLPSKDELNAMCYYSRNLSASPDPTVSCYGSSGTSQNSAFASGAYGFAGDEYLCSSQKEPLFAWLQNFYDGSQDGGGKSHPLRVRPIRAF